MLVVRPTLNTAMQAFVKSEAKFSKEQAFTKRKTKNSQGKKFTKSEANGMLGFRPIAPSIARCDAKQRAYLSQKLVVSQEAKTRQKMAARCTYVALVSLEIQKIS